MDRYYILEKLKEFKSEDDYVFAYSSLIGYIKGALELDIKDKDKVKLIDGFVNDFEEFQKWKEENRH